MALSQQHAPESTVYRHFFAGTWRLTTGGMQLDSIDPSTEEVIGSFPRAEAEDVGQAVEAADAAAPAWRALSPAARASHLNEFADRLDDHLEELARLDTRDSGNPIGAMRADVRSGAKQVRAFAGLASELRGSTAQNGTDQVSYSLLEPFGVVGRIIPFNHPLKFAAAKIAAPLLAGNSVVLKPSEQTSLSALRMAELIEDVFPPGVVSVVTGLGAEAGHALAAHPRVPRVAFTGGVPAGQSVLHAGAKSIKSISLELGGKNPFIVFPDVDIEDAVAAAIKGMNLVRSQGQSCQSTSRLFVHREIHRDFVDRLASSMEALRVGDPLDEDTDVGPVAFREHFERVLGFVEAGKQEGANLLVGGNRAREPGFFIQPALFTDVTNDMSIARNEIFGPVLSVLEWSDVDDVIRQANDSDYGLTANIWTNDFQAAHHAAHLLEAGYVWINGKGKRVPGTPFGGYKRSGLGKESSLEEVIGYTQEKVVALSL